MLSRSRYDEFIVSCRHVHLSSKELRRWIQRNRECHVDNLQQHFSYQPFNLPRAWLQTICRNLQPEKILGFQMHEGVGMSCVSRMLQVSPICWGSKGKPFNTCFFDPCSSWTAALHTLAQKPPIFRSLSDTISWETASEKKQVKTCDSAGFEDSAEQQKFAWNPQLTTCQSDNPFWKNNNKTPEFKMAKQHLGLILEALVLGHSNPWAWSDLSFVHHVFSSSASKRRRGNAGLQIHRSHDSDLLNTANKHIKHLEWLRCFDMTSQQLAIHQH